MKILLTGSSGFVGAAIAQELATLDFKLVAPLRSSSKLNVNKRLDEQDNIVGDINGNTNWRPFLKGVDVVVHCAAMSELGRTGDSQALYALRSVNVDGTLSLAQQAASAGVKRFVFLSSIKVNGEATKPGKPFKRDDSPLPITAYGKSKLDAESGLQKVANQCGMEFVVIRPPLVYGANARGNFSTLIKLVEYGFPLPLLKIKSQRSLIGVDNLVDLVTTCISHPNAANQTFLVSDDHDVTLVELLLAIAQTIKKPLRLFGVSPWLLSVAAKIFGKKAFADRILGSLQIDISETKSILGWKPSVSLKEGLGRCFPTC